MTAFRLIVPRPVAQTPQSRGQGTDARRGWRSGQVCSAALIVPLLALALLLALSSGPAQARDAAAALLQESWPSGSAGSQGAEQVSFDSADPFTLRHVGTAPRREVSARLFLPEDTEEPVPAVVLLHGAGGVMGARELTYARQFADMGVAALVLDAFGNRREMATGFIQRLMEITEAMLLADAYAGLAYLDERPEVDGERVALIGFSYGGMATIFAAYEQVAEIYSPEGQRFAGHAAFYGPCIASFRDNRSTGAPLLMLIGSEDEITDPARCAAVAEELRDGGAEVEMIVYEGAYHQWDGARPGPRRTGRNLAPCELTVTASGRVRDGRTFIPMADPLTRRLILGLCAGSEGYLMGRDEAVRARSNADLGRFLAEVFSAPRETAAK